MNCNRPKLRTKLLHVVLPILALLPLASQGAALSLSSSPLFLSNTVKPNIMFTLDNSGSMSWTEMPDSVWPDSSYGTDHCYKNSIFNKVYYNPSVTYTPGVDSSGTTLGDSTFTDAWDDGYHAYDGNTNKTNLSTSFQAYDYGGSYQDTAQAAYYYKYTGSLSNPDPGTCYPNSDYTKVTVSATSGPNGTDERQNFANWYTYYRTRIQTMKTALGESFLVLNDQYRVGFSTINSGNSNFIAIADFDSSQRTSWYNKLYSINPGGSTPLRQALDNDGQYFQSATIYGTSRTDPIQASCQQNFAILSSDGFWNGGLSNSAGNQDRTIPTLPETVSGLTAGNDWPGPYYEGTTATSNTLADVAMKYWVTDLRTSGSLSTNDVPTSASDPASWQHMTTYTIGLGANGSLTYPDDLAALTNKTLDWPTPASNSVNNIDDLWHAGINGHGKYLQASDPTGLSTGLSNILSNIVDRTGSGAAVTFNTASLSTNSSVFTAIFNSNGWTGDVISYPLDASSGAVGSTANWQAADMLDSRDLGASPRTVLTYNGTDGIAFAWANLTAAEKDDLLTNPSGGTDTTAEGQARLDFIRGDRSNEGANGYNFRSRSSRLGDIVHSGPRYVGTPQVSWPDTAPFPTTTGQRFSDFRQNNLSRQGIIYVGTNDGMLHGFNADTGAEVLAYIPSNLFSTTVDQGLHYLTDPSYLHRYYVDLSPIVTPAYVKTTPSGTVGWHSVLVGGERGGGKGVFALDVTNPNNFSEANAADLVMWEFTSANDADLGYTFSDPTIARMNNGRWAAIFGNGYNSSTGTAKLFILYLDGGLDGTWTPVGGTYTADTADYVKLDTGVGGVGNENGLSSPAVVDLDGNGTADRIYVGDLQGNMWAFDVSEASATNWGSAYSTSGTPDPLFVAGTSQPITTKPEVAFNPQVATSNSNEPNTLVLFGTGQYVQNADKTNTDTQTMYGVWDSGNSNVNSTELVEQTVESGFPSDARVMSNNAVAYRNNGNSSNWIMGWYFNLPDSGERLVTDPVLRGDYLYFNTWIPSTDLCSYGGSGWTMALDYATGGRPADAPFDYNNDGSVDTGDLLTDDTNTITDAAVSGKKTNTMTNSPRFLSDSMYGGGPNKPVPEQVKVKHISGLNTGRLSWRELGR